MLLLACYSIIFVLVLRKYIVWQSVNLILGMISIPFISTIDPAIKKNHKAAIIAVIVTALSFALPVKTMVFASVLFAVMFIIQSYFGRVNILPVLACLLMTPFFQYFVNVFSFSIRIVLSEWAGSVLKLIGDNVVVSGNIIEMNGKEFSVDPACMGLNMMVTSVLLGIVLIGILQKKYEKTIGFLQVALLLTIISVFNIISNLLRIILLVKFSLMPGTTMHEVAGLICMILYVCVPALVLTKCFVNKYGKQNISEKEIATIKHRFIPLHLLLLVAISFLAFKVDKKEHAPSAQLVLPIIKGSKVEALDDNIIKISSTNSLIYVKPIVSFYISDHNPLICWKGSGYKMKKIESEKVDGISINTGVLEKTGSVLYTAWWFDNGQMHTVNQMDWRYEMFKGSKAFSVVNITAASKEQLVQEVSAFFRNRMSEKILAISRKDAKAQRNSSTLCEAPCRCDSVIQFVSSKDTKTQIDMQPFAKLPL